YRALSTCYRKRTLPTLGGECFLLRIDLRLELELGSPCVDLAIGIFFSDAITLLEPTNQNVTLARDLFQVVVGQLAPGFADLAAHLSPIARDLVPNAACRPRSI